MPEQQETPLGRRIFEARRARGWSLRKAANQVGISYPRLDEFEKGVDGHTGKPVRPAYPTVLAMAKAYDIPAQELVALAGYELPASTLGEDEHQLLAGFRQLGVAERGRVLALVAELSAPPTGEEHGA